MKYLKRMIFFQPDPKIMKRNFCANKIQLNAWLLMTKILAVGILFNWILIIIYIKAKQFNQSRETMYLKKIQNILFSLNIGQKQVILHLHALILKSFLMTSLSIKISKSYIHIEKLLWIIIYWLLFSYFLRYFYSSVRLNETF